MTTPDPYADLRLAVAELKAVVGAEFLRLARWLHRHRVPVLAVIAAGLSFNAALVPSEGWACVLLLFGWAWMLDTVFGWFLKGKEAKR